MRQSRHATVLVPLLVLFVGLASAHSHHYLNGSWVLVPARSDFGGEATIGSGTVTIYDREHNIYVSRTFDFDSPAGTTSYTFRADGGENSSIKDGKTFKTKARWEGDVLKVTITNDNIQTVEHYSLQPDGSMLLTIERPGHSTMNLTFVRQMP